MAFCIVTNQFRMQCHVSSRLGSNSLISAHRRDYAWRERYEFYQKCTHFSTNRKNRVASTTRESNSTANHKESINISATPITKSAINHKHQKGLKSTLHLPKLEYPCFSQPVNTVGRKYGRGAVNIIGGTRVYPWREGALSLIASVTLAGVGR